MEGRFTTHHQRWLKRIRNAENKFKVAEDGIHDVLDYIEDNDLDETIRERLLDIVDKIEKFR